MRAFNGWCTKFLVGLWVCVIHASVTSIAIALRVGIGVTKMRTNKHIGIPPSPLPALIQCSCMSVVLPRHDQESVTSASLVHSGVQWILSVFM